MAFDSLDALVSLTELLLDREKTARFLFQLKSTLEETNAKIAQLNVLEEAGEYLAKAKEQSEEAERRLRAADAFGIETRAKQQKAAAEHKAAKLDLEARQCQMKDREAAVASAEQKIAAFRAEAAQAQVVLKEARECLARIESNGDTLSYGRR